MISKKVVPGLKGDHWQESDGIVLIYGGLAESVPDDEFLSVLKAVRPQRPLDGVVQVMNAAALPDTAKQDTLVRVRQKTDTQLGWQLPVWLWLVREGYWDRDGVGVPPAGALFGPGATTEEVRSTLTSLSSDLQNPGRVGAAGELSAPLAVEPVESPARLVATLPDPAADHADVRGQPHTVCVV